MNEIQPIEFTIDTTSVEQGTKRANSSIDKLRDNAVKSGVLMESAWERQARQIAKMAAGVESYGNSFERVAKGLASSVRGATEFAGAMFLGAKAIAAQTTATGALEAGWNRVRAARIAAAGWAEGVGGALTVGTEIAAVIAIEKVATAAYARSKEIQQTALASQKSGFTFQDTSALAFAAQRISKPPDYFDSAVKSAGGVQQLAQRLNELSAINDPLARVEATWKQFGNDTEKILPLLGARFGENIERAQQWGIALDEVSRSRIDGFRRDVDGIRGTFDSFGDSVAATKRQLGALLELDLSSIWELMVHGPGTLIGAVKPNIAFSSDSLDLKGAQREIQGRSSTNATILAQQEMLRSLTAPAEKAFQKDFFAKDQEADLRAEIADLRKKLYVSDRTSPEFGRLVSGASFPGGYGGQAESLQKLTSDQGQLGRVLEVKQAQKDADLAAKQAAQELASAQRSVAAGLQSAQLAELSGADRLRAERDIAIQQLGKTKQLVADIGKEYDSRFYVEGRAIIAQSSTDMQARAAVEARAQESQLTARTGYTSRAILDTIRISGEAPAKRDEVARQGADLDRESQLRQLESFDAKTLAQKAVVEAAKFQIESNYFTRVQDLEAAGIDRGYQKQLQDLKVLVDARLITEKAFNDQKSALEQNEALDQVKLAQAMQAEIERAGISSAKAVREAYQQGFQEIKSAASGLLDTLFTHPSAFPKQLAETVRSAVLKPIVDSLSDSIAGALHPLVFGGSQGGGMAATLKGLAGGRSQDPLRISSEQLKGSTDINTGATDRNTDALLRAAQSWERGSSGSGTVQAVASSTETHLRRIAESTERSEASGGAQAFGGGFSGLKAFAGRAALIGGLALPAFAGMPQRPPIEQSQSAIQFYSPDDSTQYNQRQIQQVVDSATPGFSGNVGYQSSPIGASLGDNPAAMLGVGGTAGFAGGFGGSGGGTSAGGGGFLSAIPRLFGGGTSRDGQAGGSPLSGFRNIASNFKDINFGGFTRQGQGIPGVDGQPGTDTGGSGKITGVNGLAGAGLQAGGWYLAQRGLLGQDRGTGKGIFEGAAGGAAIGFQMGGPIGAAVGAAVGAGIGLGEMLAGVESDENKAKRLVKELYHVDISIQMARQIVQIANSKYGHNVNFAIRSPEVRQMLELYSAGTNQAGKMPLSSTTPMGGSLVEQGGSLFQSQQYRFGNAYVQQSSLPVAGGGNPSVYPSPTSVQIVMQDKTSMGDLLDGRVANTVSPSFVQSQFSAAQQSSNGRLNNSAMIQQPGLITG